MSLDRKVIIVGGGLAGLSTAVTLARAKCDVTVFEQSSHLGGRARTQIFNGFYFNQGPRALFLGGSMPENLKKLGVSYSGLKPLGSSYAIKNGIKYPQPFDKQAISSSKLFNTESSKTMYLQFVDLLPKIDTEKLQTTPLKKWLEENFPDPDVIDYILMIARLVSYSNDPDIASAGAILRQMQIGTSGVLYLDGGWQTLVDGLYKRALELGAKIILGKLVISVEYDGAVKGVKLSDGTIIPASTVVIATSPPNTASLLGGKLTKLNEFASNAVQVRGACLDIALTKLPNPDEFYVLGIDKPLYMTVHSKFAKLAPNDGIVIHLLKYLSRNDKALPKENELELEGFLDLIQPGWRQFLVRQRFLPNMVVSNALLTASHKIEKNRLFSSIFNVDGLYVAGDWANHEEMLADASISSGIKAAEMIMMRFDSAKMTREMFQPELSKH